MKNKGFDYRIRCDCTGQHAAQIDITIIEEKLSSTGFATVAECTICGKAGKYKYEFPLAGSQNADPVRILRPSSSSSK